MATVCPTILAKDEETYSQQMKKIVHLAERIQIDLTDGVFAPTDTVKPEQAWWPVGFNADIHLMYKNPLVAVKEIIKHKPHLIIVHAEAEGDFVGLANLCHEHGVKVGLALLQETPAEKIAPAVAYADHVLIFSGQLGQFGGHTNLDLLDKVSFLRRCKADLEIGWDGGIDDQNIATIVSAGVDVLNVGGYIQKADDPERAYRTLKRIVDETGTT